MARVRAEIVQPLETHEDSRGASRTLAKASYTGAVPQEDFFGEVVAHLFEAEPQTCLTWIEHAGLLTERERHGVRVTTQQSLDALEHHATGSRPDMLIEAFDEEGFDAVLIESEIGSREGLEQLRCYAELLRDRSDVREKFEAVLSGGTKVNANTMRDLKNHKRYLVQARLQERSFWCGIEYTMQPEHVAELSFARSSYPGVARRGRQERDRRSYARD